VVYGVQLVAPATATVPGPGPFTDVLTTQFSIVLPAASSHAHGHHGRTMKRAARVIPSPRYSTGWVSVSGSAAGSASGSEGSAAAAGCSAA